MGSADVPARSRPPSNWLVSFTSRVAFTLHTDSRAPRR